MSSPSASLTPYQSNMDYLSDVIDLTALRIDHYKDTNGIFQESPAAAKAGLIEAASSQIRQKRLLAQAQGLIFPLAKIFTAFELDDFLTHCLLLAFYTDMSETADDDPAAPFQLQEAIWLYTHQEERPVQELLGHFLKRGKTLALLFENFGQSPPLRMPLRLERGVFSYILNGDLQPLLDLPEFVRLEYPVDLPDGGNAEVQKSLHLHAEDLAEKRLLFFLQDPSDDKKLAEVRHFCAQRRSPLLRVSLPLLLADRVRETARLLARESLLRGAVICLENAENASPDNEETRRGRPGLPFVLAVLYTSCPYVFLLSKHEWKDRGGNDYEWVPITLPPLAAQDRLHCWESLQAGYALAPDIDWQALANKFALTRNQCRQALAEARLFALERGETHIGEEDLYQGCHRQLPHNLSAGASRINAMYTWEDLILPEQQKKLIRAACDQIKYRHLIYDEWQFNSKISYGKGIHLLFSGPPGTGKTMAAQVVSTSLKLDLYKIDLSAVISKYIGETEKNLKLIFEEAKHSGAIIFFDEADALFGKRVETKDAHDRNANMETSFLLQKMEEYEGMVILATNYLQNFDDAFKRRFTFVVDFPMPDPASRLAIWQNVIPAKMPVAADVDLEFLAQQFEFSGSNIKNIVKNAAFLAAQDGSLAMSHFVYAIKFEYMKSQKSLIKDDLGPYRHLL